MKDQEVTIAQWWDTKDIAKHLGYSIRQVRGRISKYNGFPEPKRLRSGNASSQPRWKSSEIIAWAEKCFMTDEQAEIERARPRKKL
jgi:predicted DNA-binding transcriptional regulator AlpA